MFNIGGGEILVIMLIALIVLGPQRLPEAARKIGTAVGEVRRIANGFQHEMKTAFEDAERTEQRTAKKSGVKTPPTLPAANAEPTVPAEPTTVADAAPAPPAAPPAAPAATEAFVEEGPPDALGSANGDDTAATADAAGGTEVPLTGDAESDAVG
ncbi:MAG: Sec-independent protein translocase protein TatB [Acidimicrobiales bacterium]